MYQVGKLDKVIRDEELPAPSSGAPTPVLIAYEGTVLLAYRPSHITRPRDSRSFEDQVAILRFTPCLAHYLGAPNDECLGDHPLANRGLTPYGAFKVLESSWVTALELRNRAHPRHRSSEVRDSIHYVITFHDETFECVTKSVQATVRSGSVQTAMAEMFQTISGNAA